MDFINPARREYDSIPAPSARRDYTTEADYVTKGKSL